MNQWLAMDLNFGFLIERIFTRVRFTDFLKICQKKLNKVYFTFVGDFARMVEVRSAFKILTGKPTGKRLLGRPRRRWEENIRMDLEEFGINAGNWVDSDQYRNYWRALVNATLNLLVPWAMELVNIGFLYFYNIKNLWVSNMFLIVNYAERSGRVTASIRIILYR